jgi:Family of unknown function (DUF6644)
VTNVTLPAIVSGAVTWWSGLYSDHHSVSVTVRFLHLAALVVGGGTALVTDRHLLAAGRIDASARQAALALAGRSHRIVVPALAVMALTGALMAAADLETYLPSRLFWTKMALVALLVTNGALLVGAERAAAGGAGERTWMRLRVASAASAALWLTTLLAGTWLTVGA